MSIDLTTGCTRDERGHNFNCHKICQWCNRPKDEIELEKLRDAMRWRKWSEEKPNINGEYYMVMGDSRLPTFGLYNGVMFRLPSRVLEGVTHWRPIGPLPKEGE